MDNDTAERLIDCIEKLTESLENREPPSFLEQLFGTQEENLFEVVTDIRESLQTMKDELASLREKVDEIAEKVHEITEKVDDANTVLNDMNNELDNIESNTSSTD